MNLTIEQKAALFDRAVAEGRIFYLNDMSTTLERVIEAELTEFREPVWTNKVTGHRASSVCAAFRVLGFSLPYGQWAEVVLRPASCLPITPGPSVIEVALLVSRTPSLRLVRLELQSTARNPTAALGGRPRNDKRASRRRLPPSYAESGLTHTAPV